MNQDNNNVINFQNQFNNEPVYAKFDNRVLALLKDWLHMWWVVFVWYTLFFIIKVVLQANDVEISDIFTVLHISVPILFLVFGQPLYSFICECSKSHTSKGMLKTNIVVLNQNNQYLTCKDAFLRMLLKYLTLILPILLLVSVIMVVSTEKKQTLYDLLLNQVVVKK
jgi:uncharacterized RDD family membrane protein YckC